MNNTSNPICAGGERSCCPLASALDIIGDKWTLLVLRDLMFFNRHLFSDFLAAPEGISTNVLTDRLKKLEGYGLIAKNEYQRNPVRYKYQLTPVGETLRPVMIEMLRWGSQNLSNIQPLAADKLSAIAHKQTLT